MSRWAALSGVSADLMGGLIYQSFDTTFPMGTLAINGTWPFLIGLILRSAVDTSTLMPELRALLDHPPLQWLYDILKVQLRDAGTPGRR